MKTNFVFVMTLLLLVLLQACGKDDFKLRSKYVGEFAVTGTVTTLVNGVDSSSSPVTADCRVTSYDTDSVLVFWIEGFQVGVGATVDKHGLLRAAGRPQFWGRFSDEDHFALSLVGRFSDIPCPQDHDWRSLLHGVRK